MGHNHQKNQSIQTMSFGGCKSWTTTHPFLNLGNRVNVRKQPFFSFKEFNRLVQQFTHANRSIQNSLAKCAVSLLLEQFWPMLHIVWAVLLQQGSIHLSLAVHCTVPLHFMCQELAWFNDLLCKCQKVICHCLAEQFRQMSLRQMANQPTLRTSKTSSCELLCADLICISQKRMLKKD